VAERLRAEAGVASAQVAARTGSLLVEYQPGRVEPGALG